MCELFMCIKLETKCMLEDTQSCGTLKMYVLCFKSFFSHLGLYISCLIQEDLWAQGCFMILLFFPFWTDLVYIGFKSWRYQWQSIRWQNGTILFASRFIVAILYGSVLLIVILSRGIKTQTKYCWLAWCRMIISRFVTIM